MKREPSLVVAGVLISLSVFSPVSIFAMAAKIDSQWAPPSWLNFSATGDAFAPAVAVDGNGTAMALWVVDEGRDAFVWFSRFRADGGWDIPQRIEGPSPGSSSYPSLAVNDRGDALAAWERLEGGFYRVWAAAFRAGWGWVAPTIVQANLSEGGFFPTVAIGPDGSGAVVWEEHNGSESTVWSALAQASGEWGGASRMDLGLAGRGSQPSITADAMGNLALVWTQVEIRGQIMGRVKPSGGEWGPPAIVASNLTYGEAWPSVVADGVEGAVCIWLEGFTSENAVWSSRFSQTNGWGVPVLVAQPNNSDRSAVIVVTNGEGNSLASWEQMEAGKLVAFAAYSNGSTWSAPEMVGNVSLGGSRNSAASFAQDGEAVIVWEQGGLPSTEIWSNRFDPLSGWASPTPVGTKPDTDAGHPAIAVWDDGTAIALWEQDNATGKTSIWTSLWTMPDTMPPPLTITSPPIGFASTLPLVVVSGETEPGATIQAGSARATASPDGSFELTVMLTNGTNDVLVTATDHAGNVGAETIEILFEDPLPSLRARIDSLEVALNASEEENDALRAQLADAERLLNETAATVATLRAELNASAVELNQAANDLAVTRARLDSLAAEVNASHDSTSVTANGGEAVAYAALFTSLGAFVVATAVLMAHMRQRADHPTGRAPGPPAASRNAEAKTRRP